MCKIKIGIDGRNLSKPLTGTSRYVLEIVKVFEKKKIDYIIYLNSNINNEFKKYINLKKVKIFKKNNFLTRLFFFHFFLPKILLEDKIVFFWGMAHDLPFFKSKKIIFILTIFDLVFNKPQFAISKINFFREKFLTPLAIRTSDYYITLSKFTKLELIKYFKIDTKKIFTIPAGFFKIAKSRAKQSNNFKLYQPYILFVGSSSPRKNIKGILHSFANLPEEIKNKYNLLFIGSIKSMEKLIKFEIKKNKIIKNFFSLQNIEDHELSLFYKNAELLIFPSFYEGFGIPIIEAQKNGIPIITSRAASMPEVAGDAALYVNPFNYNQISLQILKILKNKKLKNQLKNKSLKNYKKFTWENCANQIIKLIKNLNKKKNA